MKGLIYFAVVCLFETQALWFQFLIDFCERLARSIQHVPRVDLCVTSELIRIPRIIQSCTFEVEKIILQIFIKISDNRWHAGVSSTFTSVHARTAFKAAYTKHSCVCVLRACDVGGWACAFSPYTPRFPGEHAWRSLWFTVLRGFSGQHLQ